MTDITKIENPVTQITLISKTNEVIDGVNNKQDVLTAGNGIDITNNEISVDGQATSEIDTETVSETTLATVATTGDYNDLINKPTIPTTTSSVTDGSTAALTSGGAYTALQGYQTTANLVTSVSSSSTDSQYPSAKLFYDTVGAIETLLSQI